MAQSYDLRYQTNRHAAEDEIIHETAIGDVLGKMILDVGCGTGNSIRLLNVHRDQYLGYDTSLDMLNKARKKFPNYNFVSSNINITERYDTILFIFGVASYLSYRELNYFLTKFSKPNCRAVLMFYSEMYYPEYHERRTTPQGTAREFLRSITGWKHNLIAFSPLLPKFLDNAPKSIWKCILTKQMQLSKTASQLHYRYDLIICTKT